MAINELAKSGVDAVQSGRSYLDQLANKYVVKPKGTAGIGGFVFDYEGDTTVSLQADVTDHWAENNQFINDHYALRPARVTLRGYVGELVLQKPQGLLGALASVQNKLTTVTAYLGKYTPQALGKVQAALTKAQSVVNKIDNTLARVKNIVGLFNKSTAAPTKQAQAYLLLEALMISRQVFVVQTPYKLFDNMVVESLSFLQDETTKYLSDVTVTLKQMRFAEVATVTANSSTFGGRAQQQRQGVTDKGKTKGTPQPVSTLYSLFHGGQ